MIGKIARLFMYIMRRVVHPISWVQWQERYPDTSLPQLPKLVLREQKNIARKDGWKLTALEWRHAMLKNTSARLIQEYTSHTGTFQSESQGSLTRYFLICSTLPNWGVGKLLSLSILKLMGVALGKVSFHWKESFPKTDKKNTNFCTCPTWCSKVAVTK